MKAIHWKLAKRILKYVQGIVDFGVEIVRNENFRLTNFTNINLVGSPDDRNSTSEYVLRLGSNAISWTSEKQTTIPILSIKEEYKVVVCKAVWAKRILENTRVQ